jgi:hypothetical protein
VSALTDALTGSVASITVESGVAPPIVINDPLRGAAGSSASLVGRLVAPKVTIRWGNGVAQPVVVAPYGDPGKRWVVVAVLAAIGAVTVGYLAIRGVRSSCRV